MKPTNQLELKRIIRKQEQLVLSMIDTMPGIVVFKDHEGHWLKANKTVLDIFQLNGIKYSGWHDKELAHYSNTPEAMLHCVETDKIMWNKGKNLTLEEQVRDSYWKVQKIPVYADCETPSGVLVMSQNITEEKLIEQKLLNDFLTMGEPSKKIFGLGS